MKLILITLLFLFSCEMYENVNQICVSTYPFSNCARIITIADNDPRKCDDIQIRLYTTQENYTLHEEYTIKDSTIYLQNMQNIEFKYGEIYLIYFR